MAQMTRVTAELGICHFAVRTDTADFFNYNGWRRFACDCVILIRAQLARRGNIRESRLEEARG